MDIVSIGLMVCDIITKPATQELFQRDSTPVTTTILPGGDACNVAINAAALGMETTVVSVVGEDVNGKYLKEYLREHGVDASHVAVSKRHGTATSIVVVEPNGERHFLTSTEIFEQLYPTQVTRSLLEGAKVLTLNSCYRLPNLDDGGIAETFRMAREMGVLTAMDTAWNRRGAWLPRIEAALHQTDLFLPSYQEAVQITGKNDVREMREVLKPYGLKIFAVKMGGDGAYVTNFDEEYFIKPFPVERVVNTVGAGDAYVAGFLTAQAKGMDAYESGMVASAVAAFTVQTIGAVGGVPPLDTVLHYIKEHRGKIEN